MEIIYIDEQERWNTIVKSFNNWDIYYLAEYAISFQLHGDGNPCLIYHESDAARLCYIMMENDISEFWDYSMYIEGEKYYDWTTPYGYGGPLYVGDISKDWLDEFNKELFRICNEKGIVSQFFRYHPILQNQRVMESISDVIYMKKTVYIDTTDDEVIFKNMTPNNRNMIRKAMKNNIEICMDKGEKIDDFIEIYNKTMNKNKASQYYYFEKEYFDYLVNNMKENIIFFYALYDGKPISTSIYFYNDTYMHYHLSGTLPEYNKFGATNYLLSSAAYWASAKGIKNLHLGGGNEAEDSLLSFKKNFNRNGLIDFCIGRSIFDKEKFDMLVDIRDKYDKDFDRNKKFMIKYRG